MDLILGVISAIEGIALLLIAGYAFSKLIARRANSMQSVVLPHDAAGDLNPARFAALESLTKAKASLESQLRAWKKVMNKTDYCKGRKDGYEVCIETLEELMRAEWQDAP